MTTQLSTFDWCWYCSHDEEIWTGPFATDQEAKDDLDGEGGYICQARKTNLQLSDFVDIKEMVEKALERMGEEHGDWEGNFVIEIKQDGPSQNLEKLTRETIEQWQSLNRVVIEPWRFTKVRNSQVVNPDG